MPVSKAGRPKRMWTVWTVQGPVPHCPERPLLTLRYTGGARRTDPPRRYQSIRGAQFREWTRHGFPCQHRRCRMRV